MTKANVSPDFHDQPVLISHHQEKHYYEFREFLPIVKNAFYVHNCVHRKYVTVLPFLVT